MHGPIDQSFEFNGLVNFHQPRAAALLGRLERDALPARDFALHFMAVANSDVSPRSSDRNDARCAQLSSFLHYQIELLAFQQSDRQREIEWGFGTRGLDFFKHIEYRAIAIEFAH